MLDAAKIRGILERAVHDVFAARVPGLRDELMQQVLRQLETALTPATDAGTGRVKAALSSIHGAATQADVLSNLLDAVAGFSGRVALFVVRGTAATGWQARGFMDNDAVRTVTLDLAGALVGQAFQRRLPVEGPASQFDGRFNNAMGAPLNGQCQVLPLVIRDKVAAIVYADAGAQPTGVLDGAAVQVLVSSAGMWLELLALRKSAGVPTVAGGAQSQPSSSAAAAAATSTVPPLAPTVPGGSGGASFQADASSGGTEDELQRKARRFAKLLVDEIKLYNQVKVKEGKQNRDLYDRLKDDIDKSRASFDQRYAQTAAADYFAQELIRNLADNDPGVLGSNFSR